MKKRSIIETLLIPIKASKKKELKNDKNDKNDEQKLKSKKGRRNQMFLCTSAVRVPISTSMQTCIFRETKKKYRVGGRASSKPRKLNQ